MRDLSSLVVALVFIAAALSGTGCDTGIPACQTFNRAISECNGSIEDGGSPGPVEQAVCETRNCRNQTQLDEAVRDCAYGFPHTGWSADQCTQYRDCIRMRGSELLPQCHP